MQSEKLIKRQQQERQYDLKLLGQWQEAAIALGRPASCVERIQEITFNNFWDDCFASHRLKKNIMRPRIRIEGPEPAQP